MNGRLRSSVRGIEVTLFDRDGKFMETFSGIRVAGCVLMTGIVVAVAGPASAISESSYLATPTSVSTTSVRPSNGPSTLVRFVVRNCEGCTIGVQRGLANEPATTVVPTQPDYWNGPTAKVRNGLAMLSVPTAVTSGMSFTLSAPWEGDTEAITNIVLGGAGPVGRTFTTNQAENRKRATACWAGTTASSTTINVSVARRTMKGAMDKSEVFAVAWASPSVAVIGRLSPTVSGMLANQDMYFC